MDHILDEFRLRREPTRSLDADRPEVRLLGFYEWLQSTPQTMEIIDHLLTHDVSVIMNEADKDHPPNAATLEEIAGVGFWLLDECGKSEHRLGRHLSAHCIKPSNLRTTSDIIDEAMQKYIDPAFDYVERELEKQEADSDLPAIHMHRDADWFPPEIAESLPRFLKDHPDTSKNAFLMMKFGETGGHGEITVAVRGTLKKFGMKALRADDREYHEDLFPNVLTYIFGCRFGIAVFERLLADDFNPNVSLEVGYLMARRKPVCFLRDQTLEGLQTALVGKLYRPFDTQSPATTIPGQLESWMRDRDILTT